MRSRQMRHDRAPEEEDVRKDWIFERSEGVVVVMVEEEWRPVNSK